MNTPPPHDLLDIAPEVAAALAEGRAVVALETSILAQGLPFPVNIETAHAVEARVRAEGAVPATIAVLDGRIRVGLGATEIERLGSGGTVLKLSRADLAYAVSTRRDGATTVAATLIVAHLAGIRAFATGGIGGVHRGVAASWDMSADLEELARRPVCTVSAGAKAILDLPKTLEVLETKGVPIIGFGTSEFPAFWSRSSGLRLTLRLDTVEAVADLLAAQARLGLEAGCLVANPIPQEHEIPRAEIESVVDKAVAEAERAGISGKAVTPFLLERVVAATAGRSLAANIALVEANAALAARIALACAAG
jgi:pseudouridylate synthase